MTTHTSIVQANLPDVLQDNPVFTQLSEYADYLPLLSVLTNLLTNGEDLTSLNKTPSQWSALGVPDSLVDGLTDNLANWLCKSVGAVDGQFFLPDWNPLTKLSVAQAYLNWIVPFKGTYHGLERCLELFSEQGLWDNWDINDVAPNFFDLDIHIPRVQVGIDSWQQIPDRNGLEFRTLRMILEFHNPLGVGLVWADWLNNGADYSLAEDRCVYDS